MLKKGLLFSVVVAAAALTGLLAVELTARLLFPDRTGRNIALRLTSEKLTWARPDAEFHHVGDGIYRLNFPDEAEDGTNRVLIVGDSFAMGHGVGEENRFGRLLQRHLRRGTAVDVLATSGYSPVIYRNIVRKALSLAPYRAVVVFVDQTDPTDDFIYQEDLADASSRSFNVAHMAEREKTLDRAYSELLASLSSPFGVRRSAAVNILSPPSLLSHVDPNDPHHRYIELSVQRSALIRDFNARPDTAESRKMLSLMEAHLDEIVADCRRRQIPLFLAATVWEFQSSKRPRVTFQLPGPFPRDNLLDDFLAKRFGDLPGVHVVRLTGRFREPEDPSAMYLDRPAHEVHWNAEGHRLAEAVLRERLTAVLPDLGP